MINRRDLLSSAWAIAAANALDTQAVVSEDRQAAPVPMIVDTNVSLFHWPFRRLPLDEPSALSAKLQSLGIREAWAGSFEGILHRDVRAVNDRLAEVCSRFPRFVPIGTLNPELPGWESDLQRCIEQHEMPGVRLYPNYHGYRLNDECFLRLLQLATEQNRFVQIAATMEDTRTQHPLVQVLEVDLTPLASAIGQCAGAAVQILNWRPQQSVLNALAAIPGVFLDIARLEATDGIAKLIRGFAPSRVLYGSHAPFLIPEAALIRAGESQLESGELRSLLSANADQLCKSLGR